MGTCPPSFCIFPAPASSPDVEASGPIPSQAARLHHCLSVRGSVLPPSSCPSCSAFASEMTMNVSWQVFEVWTRAHSNIFPWYCTWHSLETQVILKKVKNEIFLLYSFPSFFQKERFDFRVLCLKECFRFLLQSCPHAVPSVPDGQGLSCLDSSGMWCQPNELVAPRLCRQAWVLIQSVSGWLSHSSEGKIKLWHWLCLIQNSSTPGAINTVEQAPQ